MNIARAARITAAGIAMLTAAILAGYLLANVSLILALIIALPLTMLAVPTIMVPWHLRSMEREGLITVL